MAEPDKAVTQADVKVDFSDPVPNSRKMLLSNTPPAAPEPTAVGAGGSADAVADSIRRGSPVR
jgi:hypothetical protein